MSQTQVATPQVAVQQFMPGVQVTSAMTPEERFNTIAKAMGAPPVNAPHVTFSGPQGHPHVVVPDGEASSYGKAPPPTPTQLERQNSNVAEFDAEMRAKGLQRTDMATAPGEVNHEAIQLIGDRYRSLVRGITNPEQAARHTAQYQKDLKALYDGQQLSETQMATLRKAANGGNDGSFMPAPPKGAKPAPTQAAPTWQAHVKDGQVDLDKITVADTSGYTLKRFVEGQTLKVEAFEQLKRAKAAGFSQAQVDAYLHQDAVNLGWVKA